MEGSKRQVISRVGKPRGGQVPWLYAKNKARNHYICTHYADHGIRIILEHNESKSHHHSYFIRMVVNPRKPLDPKASYLGILEPTSDCIKKISKAFRKLFQKTPFEEDIDVYYLTRVDLCTNIRCSNSKIFRELIRASQKLPTPAKFERKYYQDKDKQKANRYNKHYICFACGTYELVMYDKTYHMIEDGLALSYEKLPEGVLRYELRLSRSSIQSIEKRCKLEDVSHTLAYFVKDSKAIMISTFDRLFPPAWYMRQPDLLKYIWNCAPYQDYTRHTMTGLVEQIGAGYTITEALQHMKKDQEAGKELLARFEQMDISPIPLRKNFSAEKVPNPTYLLMSLPKDKPVVVEYVQSK